MQFTEEHGLLRETVRAFLAAEVEPHVGEWEEAGVWPAHEVLPKAAAAGLLGIEYDPAYGGQGMDHSFTVVLGEEFGRAWSGVTTGMSVHTDMATPALHRFGTHELKQRYLAPALGGTMVAAVAVTEPDTGSDVAAIRCRAVRDGDDWVITGRKLYITNGSQADWVCLLARTSDDPGHRGLSQVVVPTASEGFSVGRVLSKVGLRSSDTAELVLDDVRVPVANTIGEVGRGFYQQMAQLAPERMMSAYRSVGACQRALERTKEYLATRTTFGRPLLDSQHIQFRLAELTAEVETCRHYTYACADAMVRGDDVRQMSAIAKLTASRLVHRVASTCLQFHGALGYMEDNWTARFFRDSRVASIAGGSDEMMLQIIAKAAGYSR